MTKKSLINSKLISDARYTFKELYEIRTYMFALVCNLLKNNSYISDRHYDNSMFDGDFIAWLESPTGDISFHFKKEYQELYNNIKKLDYAPLYDNYTTDDVFDRMVTIIYSIREKNKSMEKR